MKDDTLKELFDYVKNARKRIAHIKNGTTTKLIQDEVLNINDSLIKHICFYVDSVTSFVPKFRLKYVGQKPIFKESVATIEDIDERGNPIKIPLGPVGFSYETHIFSLSLDRKTAEERVSNFKDNSNVRSGILENLISSLITFSFALRKAACILQTCNIDDIKTSWAIHEENCYIFLFDNAEGGNGVTYLTFSELKEDLENNSRKIIDTRLFRQILEIFNQKCCKDVCEECLLLPRTPHYLVSLLNKRLGKMLLLGTNNDES